MNIAETCFNRRVVTFGLAAALALAGVMSYFKLGRLEDPEFTIRSAQIVTSYPGANAQEVAERVTDPIETAAQRIGCVKHVTSSSRPGLSIVTVDLKDEVSGEDLPRIWTQLRHKIDDMTSSLPVGCSEPTVNDDYGDVYGIFYAIWGDGFSYADLKEHAKLLRRELLMCKDVAKVDMIGDRTEAVYLDIPCSRLAALGLTPEKVRSALEDEYVPVASGNYRSGDKYIRIRSSGLKNSFEQLGDIQLAPKVFLKNVAKVTRAYETPPQVIVRYNGHPAIGLGISTAKGGNVIEMGDAVSKRMNELLSETPTGIELGVISHQATSVVTAVDGFVENLLESVFLVVAVLLITMGLRSGLIIGGVLILTVLATVFVMQMKGLMFERISLGAFIIALGMLVDNAIVITEAVLVAAQTGQSKKDAAINIVKQSIWPLLGGTVIAILSFAPIGASQNSTGEYCRSLFQVIAISLFLSWVFAISVTPLFAATFLPSVKPASGSQTPKDPYGGLFFRCYRRALEWCIDNRWFVVLTLVCLLLMSVFGFRFIDQNFFPPSTRPQFMVHVWMPEGTAVEKTDVRAQRLTTWIRTLDGVKDVSSVTGSGALRMLLTYTPEDSDSAYTLLLVDVKDSSAIGRLMAQIEKEAPSVTPDAMISCQRFVLGPGAAQKIQVRIVGYDVARLRSLGALVEGVFRKDGHFKELQSDWRNRAEVIEPVISERRARQVGLMRADITRAFRCATDGLPVGMLLERDEQIPILLRSAEDPRNAWAWSDVNERLLPIAQFVDSVKNVSEERRLARRDRKLCITVKCNPQDNETADSAFTRVLPRLEALAKTLPPGYEMQWGGEYEDSKEASETLAPSFGPILAAMFLTVLALFNSFKKTFVIFLTLPLILVGVVAGLLSFNQPFGFMALLGLLSLVGMQVKTAIVLMDEINANFARGLTPYAAVVDAGVSRLRPVFNSSVTTILGMLPLIADAFYAAMAVTIMIGLTFATVFTLVVVPVLYALLFRIHRD